MLRILMAILVASLLLVGYAWADDDFYGTDVIDQTDAPNNDETATQTEVVQAGEPVPIEADKLGMYFGLGEEFKGGVPSGEDTYYLMHDHDVATSTEGYSYHDEMIYPPDYTGQGANPDNVYGPMWGVPDDASGLDNYNPQYYLYDPNSDQVWTPYQGDGQVVQPDSGDDTAADQEDGIEVGDVDW